MGRFTITCPVTGELQTYSNLPPGAEFRPRYSARATAQEIDVYEEIQRRRFKPTEEEPFFRPFFGRHPHQEHPPEHT